MLKQNTKIKNILFYLVKMYMQENYGKPFSSNLCLSHFSKHFHTEILKDL